MASARKRTSRKAAAAPARNARGGSRAGGSSRLTRRDRVTLSPRQRKWLVYGMLGLGLLLAAYILWPRGQAPSALGPDTLAGQVNSPSGSGGDPSLGPANAPVTIVEYGDFGCATCQAWYKARVLEQARAKYGDKIRFVWRDFPVITAQSPKAAEAGQCAFDQGKFWPYHDSLYNHAPALSIDNLKDYAKQLGLDIQQFDQCLDSGQHAAKVQQSLKEALAHGFTGTPSFLVNEKPVEGPPSLAYLSQLIDTALAGR